MHPKPCVGCGTLIESSGDGPYGAIRESRLQPNEYIISPPLCWDCRGAVILNMPPIDQFVMPAPGPLGEMGFRCANLPQPGSIPILRIVTD